MLVTKTIPWCCFGGKISFHFSRMLKPNGIVCWGQFVLENLTGLICTVTGGGYQPTMEVLWIFKRWTRWGKKLFDTRSKPLNSSLMSYDFSDVVSCVSVSFSLKRVNLLAPKLIGIKHLDTAASYSNWVAFATWTESKLLPPSSGKKGLIGLFLGKFCW